MEGYDSILGNVRATVQLHTDAADVQGVDFFNTAAYFRFHAKDAPAWYFRLVDTEKGTPLCVAHFTQKEPGFFRSPLRGTYGGIEVLGGDVSAIDVFVAQVEEHLRTAGAKTVELALAPFAHNPNRSALVLNVLLRHGYTIVRQDINYHLPVDAEPLLEKMERNNKKRVRKCQREGCVFSQCTSEAEFAQVYDVIRQNRQSKGFPVTMDFEHLMTMKKMFPDVWQFFATRRGDTMIASSVCIRIHPNVLYVFYWGDLPSEHAYSPVAFHAENLYRYCQQEKIGILDIGTSTDSGVPNVGLMTFKSRLGCQLSPKLVMSKTLQ